MLDSVQDNLRWELDGRWQDDVQSLIIQRMHVGLFTAVHYETTQGGRHEIDLYCLIQTNKQKRKK